jgi:UDP-4-amino-4,6-dideoxy-N-acetyl-beta-L-altrosamine transaminase
MDIIPYARQHITQEDINVVIETLKSDFLTQGPKIVEFEEAFANYLGAKFAVAVTSGTAALHLCTLALDVSKGKKVITTPITFVASANCIRYCDGEVVFADIDPETYIIDYHSVEKLLEASPIGTYQGIIPVDLAGRAVDLEKFRTLADKYNLWIIEDACHAPGGFFVDSKGNNQNCGNGNFADLAIFSFHPVKHITSGEGGMITTNDEKLYNKLKTLRNHGITRDNVLFQNDINFASDSENQIDFPTWYMEMQMLGFNYRLTDFQAALGLSQLQRAQSGILRRREIALIYDNAFRGKCFVIRQSRYVEGHAFHLYILEVQDRIGLYNYLRKNNVFTQIHYIPCHLMPYYKDLGWKEGDMPKAERYYKNCISLPMYATLSIQEQQYTIDLINSFYVSN